MNFKWLWKIVNYNSVRSDLNITKTGLYDIKWFYADLDGWYNTGKSESSLVKLASSLWLP